MESASLADSTRENSWSFHVIPDFHSQYCVSSVCSGERCCLSVLARLCAEGRAGYVEPTALSTGHRDVKLAWLEGCPGPVTWDRRHRFLGGKHVPIYFFDSPVQMKQSCSSASMLQPLPCWQQRRWETRNRSLVALPSPSSHKILSQISAPVSVTPSSKTGGMRGQGRGESLPCFTWGGD